MAGNGASTQSAHSQFPYDVRSRNERYPGAPLGEFCWECSEHGLMIMPVRYAVMAPSLHHDMRNIPVLQEGSTFGAGVTDIKLNKGRYLLRLVRRGYLYVFYPQRQDTRWEVYRTGSGFISGHPISKADGISGEYHPDSIFGARYIRIMQPKSVGTIYLAFSDAWWTEQVRSTVEECPAKVMQPFDVTGWMAGNYKQPHAAKVDELPSLLPEYKMALRYSQLLPSASDYKTEASELWNDYHQFRETCFPLAYRPQLSAIPLMNERSDGAGALFALHDPVGITQELNREQHLAYLGLMEKDNLGWKWSSYASINFLRKLSDRHVDNLVENYNNGAFNSDGMPPIEPITDYKGQEDKIWVDYESNFDKSEWSKFPELFQQMVEIESKATLIPISKDHAVWLDSAQFHAVFKNHFDGETPECSVDYVSIFIRSIEDAIDRNECREVLQRWAESDAGIEDNLLLRAFCGGIRKLAEKLEEEHQAVSSGTRTIVDASGKLVKAFRQWFSFETGSKNGTRRTDDLLVRIGTEIARLAYHAIPTLWRGMKKTYDRGVTRMILAMSQASGKAIDLTPVTRSLRGWMEYLLRVNGALGGEFHSAADNAIRDAAEKMLTENPDGSKEITIEQAVPQDVPDQPSTDATTQAERTAASRLSPKTIKSVSVGLVSINVLFSITNLCLVGLTMRDQGWEKANDELKWKFRSSTASVINGALGAFKEFLKDTKYVQRQDLEAGLFFRVLNPTKTSLTFADKIDAFGRSAGAVGVAISFYLDVEHAMEQHREGNEVLYALYSLSAVVDAVTVVAFIVAASGAFVPLYLFAIALSLLIMWLTPEPIVVWLRKCQFGKDKINPFASLDKEREELEAVARGYGAEPGRLNAG